MGVQGDGDWMEKQKRRWIRPAVHREGGKLLGSILSLGLEIVFVKHLVKDLACSRRSTIIILISFIPQNRSMSK